ncbi:cystathionine gamma-synthase family protein [Glaciecola siphonariae]|uniref:Cystathionine gamma-synthase family protein n=1 Tax=Glaciecola siphonariae TaxID=521012 RepID=A0ABV9LTS1_9ALTE
MNKPSDRSNNTQLVHADRLINRPQNGAVHEPTNNSVLFEFEDVADLEAVFQGKQAGHVYSRSSSGSAVALQNMLNHIEGGVGAVVFATGMAAISSSLFSLLKAGDHIIVSQYLFGNTLSFFKTLANFAIEVSYIDVTDVDKVAGACKANTKMVFCESIANPGTQISDLDGISALCREQNIVFAIDNTMTPAPMLDAKAIGASLVLTSLTKYIGGHGNVLGGVVVDLGNFDWQSFENISDTYKVADPQQWGLTQIRKRGLRDMGATLAPSAAHQVAVGLETLNMRMQKTCENALCLAEFFEKHDAITKVFYPGLQAHPQHERASHLFNRRFGGILSIELAEHIDVRHFLNALNLVICATHLGDTRTLALPVATTIFHENGAQQRSAMGIADGLIRLSIGIEETKDLIDDITQALDAVRP